MRQFQFLKLGLVVGGFLAASGQSHAQGRGGMRPAGPNGTSGASKCTGSGQAGSTSSAASSTAASTGTAATSTASTAKAAQLKQALIAAQTALQNLTAAQANLVTATATATSAGQLLNVNARITAVQQYIARLQAAIAKA